MKCAFITFAVVLTACVLLKTSEASEELKGCPPGCVPGVAGDPDHEAYLEARRKFGSNGCPPGCVPGKKNQNEDDHHKEDNKHPIEHKEENHSKELKCPPGCVPAVAGDPDHEAYLEKRRKFGSNGCPPGCVPAKNHQNDDHGL